MKIIKNKKIMVLPGIDQNAVIKKEKVLSPEERQAQALEKIVAAIALSLQSNDENAQILLKTIRKIEGFGNVKMPEFPKPIKRWRFNVLRDGGGFIKEIIAKEDI